MDNPTSQGHGHGIYVFIFQGIYTIFILVS